MISFEDIKNQTPKDIQIFIEKSFEIADEVDFILEKKNKNRAFLATKLNKNESEISKWLSGLHNLTIKSISKIEACLGESIISTPSLEAKKNEHLNKSFEFKIKKLQRKCEMLISENEKLKKIIDENSIYDVDSVYQPVIYRKSKDIKENMGDNYVGSFNYLYNIKDPMIGNKKSSIMYKADNQYLIDSNKISV